MQVSYEPDSHGGTGVSAQRQSWHGGEELVADAGSAGAAEGGARCGNAFG